jgi:tetratricopeptide (TPR) repeat protein
VLERRALAGAPEDLVALVDELNLAGERHRAAEALRRLEAAATTPAWQVELWHVRAKGAALAGRVREAVELARRALEVPGASFGSQNHARGFLLVMAAGRQGGLDAERGLLDALVKDSGRAAGVGVMLAWAGSGEASATRMMPRGLRRVVVAIARWRAGDPDSAIAELQRFGLEADRLPLWLLGEVQLERGRPREAAAALEAFLRSGAEAWTAPRSLARLAQARAALGDRPGARAALDRYFRLLDRPDPDLPLLAEARSLRASLAGVQ